MASWDSVGGSGIGFQRRGLAHFDDSKWFMVQFNANRLFLFSVKNDRHQKLAATSVLFISTRSTIDTECSIDLAAWGRWCLLTPARDRSLLEECCCRCLGLLRMPLQGRFALGGLLNKWRRGWREEVYILCTEIYREKCCLLPIFIG